jgi:hypothetical protein
MPELLVADLVRDRRILEAARREAEAMHASLDAKLLSELVRRYGDRLDLAGIG